MAFSDRFDQTEANSGALGFAAEFAAEAVELLEDPRVLGGRDAGAMVGDFDLPVRRNLAERDFHLGASGRELDGVIQQVDEESVVVVKSRSHRHPEGRFR